MADLREMVLENVMEHFKRLTWQCKGCYRMDWCDTNNGADKMYCEEIVVAAILAQRTFQYKTAPQENVESANLQHTTGDGGPDGFLNDNG